MTAPVPRPEPVLDEPRAPALPPVELLLVDDGNHVANNRGYLYRTQSADWMATQLRISTN